MNTCLDFKQKNKYNELKKKYKIIEQENAQLEQKLMKAHKRMKRLRLEKRADKLNNDPQSSSYSFRILQDELKKKKKNPNAPKCPGNVFFLFCRMERDKIKPKENVGELNKSLALKWKLMTKEQKKVYHDFFKKEMKEYEGAIKSLKLIG